MYSIYLIQNKTDGKVYTGQSINYKSRWGTHLWSLRKGNHHCAHLQRAWNKYAEDNFDFTLLQDNLSQDEANYWEKALIDWFADLELAYNPCWNHMGRGEVSEETRQKMSENSLRLGLKPPSQKGVKRSLESIEKMKATCALRRSLQAPKEPKKLYCKTCGVETPTVNSNYCDPCRETKRKIDRANQVFSEEQRQRLRELRLGKPLSEESKKKQSESLKKRLKENPDQHRFRKGEVHISRDFCVISPKGIIYEGTNVSKFCRDNNLGEKFKELVRGKIKSYKGWKLYKGSE